MDIFVLFLLVLAIASLVLTSLSYALYPIASITLTATNPLAPSSSSVALASTIHWDPFSHRNDGGNGDISSLAVQGTDIGLSQLPQIWLTNAARECVHDQLLFAVFVSALTIVSLHTIVALLLSWSTPSHGDVQDMKRRLAKFAAEDALDAAAAVGMPSAHDDDDDDGASPRTKFLRGSDTKFFVSQHCQRIVVGTGLLVLGMSCVCCVFVFVTRTCIERQMISYFREESRRTRFLYSATTTSWPAFFMCFSAVATFCSLVAVVHWTGFGHCGPTIFLNIVAVESEGFAHAATTATMNHLQLAPVVTSPSKKRSARQVTLIPPPPQMHKELYNL
ncbi:Hypothetical protein, putative [Bodo saltans]|uniref:Uncharacterized protein n=1 Tax=Bodo saltans TaxID=75058 RepID=A0A0S4JI34_BODSA|nr:Hypothetical protein, putative [Bodo saltans]|eukprot:CUG90034.1 Hypothetical protein, putative [Bodo saltans]